jgi:hypothetical protein
VDRSNPPVTAEIDAPAEVVTIFKHSCYDCHSNETDWRWYSYVAPVSWLTSNDVEDARGHLNFSEWGNLAAHKQAKKTEEIWDEISKDGMPLKIYTLVHPDTKLSGMQKETVKTWAMAGEGMETGSHEEGEKEEGEHEGHNH